jgi:hypothetical protein
MSEDLSPTAAPLPPQKRNLELWGMCSEATKRTKKEDKGKQTSIDSRALRKAQTGRVFPQCWWEFSSRVANITDDMDHEDIKEEINEQLDDFDSYQLKQVLHMCLYLQETGEQ